MHGYKYQATRQDTESTDKRSIFFSRMKFYTLTPFYFQPQNVITSDGNDSFGFFFTFSSSALCNIASHLDLRLG